MGHALNRGTGISLYYYVQYLVAYGTLIGPEPGVHYARTDQLRWYVRQGGVNLPKLEADRPSYPHGI